MRSAVAPGLLTCLVACLAATGNVQATEPSSDDPADRLSAETVPALPRREDIQLDLVTEQAFHRSGADVRRRQLPGGIEFADHNAALQNVTVARLGADGAVETHCTSDRDSALDFLAGTDRGATPAASSRSAPSPKPRRP